MSMESHYYVIAGYDLTGNETDKFKDLLLCQDLVQTKMRYSIS